MEVRAGSAACAAHQADHLTLLNDVTNIHQYFRLVPKATVNAPAMIDDSRVATNS